MRRAEERDLWRAFGGSEDGCGGLRCAADAAMMQTTDLGDCDDRAASRRLD